MTICINVMKRDKLHRLLENIKSDMIRTRNSTSHRNSRLSLSEFSTECNLEYVLT